MNVPTLHGVALRAIGAELTTVKVGVAIHALLSDVGEHQARMAQRASNLLVHPQQGVTR